MGYLLDKPAAATPLGGEMAEYFNEFALITGTRDDAQGLVWAFNIDAGITCIEGVCPENRNVVVKGWKRAEQDDAVMMARFSVRRATGIEIPAVAAPTPKPADH